MTFLHTLIRLGLFLLGAIVTHADARAQEVSIAPRFEGAGNFQSGVAPVLLDKQWGLIDRSGAFVVRPRFTGIKRGGNGLFGVQDGMLWGFADATGKTRIEPKFEDVEPFENGVAPVKMGGRWGYIRTDGTMETAFTFMEIAGREGAFVSARDAQGWAIFRIGGGGPPEREEISEARRASSISESTVVTQHPDGERLHVIVSRNDAFGVLQIFPRFSAKEKFIQIRRMSEGFAPATTAANTWGFLHKTSGEYLWRSRFEDAQQFAQGFAPVKLAGRWGYIDRAGRPIIPPTYEAAFPFRGDYAVIRQADKRGFLRLDPDGGASVFIEPRYEDAFRFTEGLAPVKIGGRWGYISDGRPWSELIESGIVDIRPR
jgi:hypothetical protein